MDIKDILEGLTRDDIVSFMEYLGADISSRSNDKELIFTSICHNLNKNGRHKLYYYIESRNFYCWSNCGQIGNLLDLLIHINGYEVKEGIRYLKEFFNLSNIPRLRRGFKIKKKYKKPTLDDIELELLTTPNKPFIYSLYKQIRLNEWEKDGITFETLKKFDIRYDVYNQQIIIPHFCWNDKKRVVGIRVRNLDEVKVTKYGKYCPMICERTQYNHPLSKNLYGMNINKENIKKYKKCIIVESEKGVMQLNDMYPNSNIGLGICGSNLSQFQKKILVSMDIKECLFVMDKQYQTDLDRDIWKYKIAKMAQELIQQGITCYMLLDEIDGLLDYKDSPVDKGKDIFNKLVKNKINIEEGTNDKL